MSVEKTQEFASIASPGSWITNDDSNDATLNKIGGSAKFWINNRSQIKHLKPQCQSCKQKMYLLTQINAPLMAESLQRTIYVFMCLNTKCTINNKGWSVIIQKGPHINKYKANVTAPTTNTGNNNQTLETTKNNDDSMMIDQIHAENEEKMKDTMDQLNDDFAKLMAKQQELFKQLSDKKTQKKAVQKKKQKKQKKAKLLDGMFIPFQLCFYDELYYKNTAKPKYNKSDKLKWSSNFKELMNDANGGNNDNDSDGGGGDDGGNGNGNNDDDDCKMENDDYSQMDTLSDYLERVGVDQTQCIRYCYGDYPFLPFDVIGTNEIPKCRNCGNARVFEFQIMSNLLNYLEPKQIDHEWMTVLVYVCPLTCKISDKQFVLVCLEK